MIGAGMAFRPHALSLLDLAARVEVVGVFSRSEARRGEVAESYGFTTADSIDGLLRDDRVDCVLVLTPANAHLDIVGRGARAVKHILLEKPVEVDVARAEAVVAAARDADVQLGVTLHYRTRANARYLAALVADGSLGKLVTASASIRWWRTQAYYDEPGRGTLARDGGGVLITQAIHALDLFMSLTGSIVSVAAMTATSRAHRMECEDVACAAVRFANGAIGSIAATTASFPGFPERLELVYDKATALLEGEALSLFWHDGSSEHRPAGSSHGGGADPMAYTHEHHRAVLDDFMDALDHGRPPLIPGHEALKVHYLIDALLRSNSSGKIEYIDEAVSAATSLEKVI